MFALLLLGLASALADPSPITRALSGVELRETHWPDGSLRSRAEGVVDADGTFVLNGAWSEWHDNGELAFEGPHEDGLRHGRWMAYHRNGKRWWRVRYEEGERDGTWKSWHARGKKHEVGRFELGWRTGDWNVWDVEGELDEESGGVFETRAHRVGRRDRWRVELLDGVREGRYAAWWSDGTLQAEGAFAAGAMSGEWRFFHEDGVFDPDFVTGVWEAGRRVRPLPAELLAGWRAEEPVPAAQTRPRLAADEVAARMTRDELRAALERALEGGAEPQSLAVAFERVPAVVDWLVGLSPEKPGDAEFGAQLEGRVLAPIYGGQSFGWRATAASEDVEHNRWVQRRWRSLWLTTAHDPGFALIDLQLAERWGGSSSALSSPPIARTPAAERCAEGLFSARFTPPSKRSGAREVERDERIERAVDWLRRNQSSDGSWTMVDGAGTNPKQPKSVYDDGITGLALLALLASGNTPAEGPASMEVARACGHLLALVDPETGHAPRLSLDANYGLAASTWALSEVLAAYESPVLRRATQRMVDSIHAARLPNSGWRYDYPPQGTGDTSVTAWMFLALIAADAAGLRTDLEATGGAFAFFEEMTEEASGRVGYDTRGSVSARTVANSAFPREVGEAMTAAVLVCHLVAGKGVADPMQVKQLALVQIVLPLWSEEGHHDLYYWHWASSAMALAGEPWWPRWEKAQSEALGDSQIDGGADDGSWDPLGPWAFQFGRVYSTSIGALALLAPRRYSIP